MRVWMPLPDRDFEPGEAALPWRALVAAGHEVVFATERGGAAPEADPRLLRGVLFGRMGASREAKQAYREMAATTAYAHPIAWDSVTPSEFDGLLLPGGHAPGMRQYPSRRKRRASQRGAPLPRPQPELRARSRPRRIVARRTYVRR